MIWGGFDTGVAGDYTVSYAISNNHGLKSEKTQTIHVVDEMGDHEGIALAEADMELLIGLKYFQYEVLNEDNYDAAVERVAPSLVNLFSDELDVPDPERYTGSASGSGCIYKIEKDYIYISSNTHVFRTLDQWTNVLTVYAYDGDTFRLNYLPEPVNDEKVDIGMIRIPISEIPPRILLKLKEIAYAEALDDEFEQDTPIFMYAPQWSGGRQTQLKQLSIVKYENMDAEMRDFAENTEGRTDDGYFISTHGAVGGMSGTGIFDYKGRFVGSCSSHIWYAGHPSYDINVDSEYLPKMYDLLKGER